MSYLITIFAVLTSFSTAFADFDKALLIKDLTNHGRTTDGRLVIVSPSPIKQIKERLALRDQFTPQENQLTELEEDSILCVESKLQSNTQNRLAFTERVIESGFIVPGKDPLIKIEKIESCIQYINSTSFLTP